MTFRDRLLKTLHASCAVLEVPGVLVGGSEVPNLLEKGARVSALLSRLEGEERRRS